jgi:hypothetical protein
MLIDIVVIAIRASSQSSAWCLLGQTGKHRKRAVVRLRYAVTLMSSHLAAVYRARAEECFRLAEEDDDSWIAKALEDLGRNMLEAADEIEPISLPS